MFGKSLYPPIIVGSSCTLGSPLKYKTVVSTCLFPSLGWDATKSGAAMLVESATMMSQCSEEETLDASLLDAE